MVNLNGSTPWAQIFQWIFESGFSISETSHDNWLKEISKFSQNSKNIELKAMKFLASNSLPIAKIVNHDNTSSHLFGKVTCPEINKDFIALYVNEIIKDTNK